MPIELGPVTAQAADYLKADCLLDLACAAVANAAKGTSLCVSRCFRHGIICFDIVNVGEAGANPNGFG